MLFRLAQLLLRWVWASPRAPAAARHLSVSASGEGLGRCSCSGSHVRAATISILKLQTAKKIVLTEAAAPDPEGVCNLRQKPWRITAIIGLSCTGAKTLCPCNTGCYSSPGDIIRYSYKTLFSQVLPRQSFVHHAYGTGFAHIDISLLCTSHRHYGST